MSAWGVGASTSEVRLATPDAGSYVGRVVRWIPGDVVALYGAAILWVTPEPLAPSLALWWWFVAAAPVVTLAGAFATRNLKKFDAVKAALAAVAFAIWSLSVPRSGWQQLGAIAANPGWVIAASALGGVIFGLVASGIERKFGGSDGA